ncbi:unnamed protein product [Brassica oleracea var. botrytis]
MTPLLVPCCLEKTKRNNGKAIMCSQYTRRLMARQHQPLAS